MKSSNYEDYNDLFERTALSLSSDKGHKHQKRKWREIENFKEDQQLRNELIELNDYAL